MKKLMLLGHKRHGKDTVAEMLAHYGLSSISSSMFACQDYIFDKLKDQFGYANPQECFDDRQDKRGLWFDLIREYNSISETRLAEGIFKHYDIYNGCRARTEFEAVKAAGLYDLCIWIDRSEHLPEEEGDSMQLTRADADLVIDNNGSLIELRQRVADFMECELPELRYNYRLKDGKTLYDPVEDY